MSKDCRHCFLCEYGSVHRCVRTMKVVGDESLVFHIRHKDCFLKSVEGVIEKIGEKCICVRFLAANAKKR